MARRMGRQCRVPKKIVGLLPRWPSRPVTTLRCERSPASTSESGEGWILSTGARGRQAKNL